jgi:hypothetical protein
MIFTGEGAVLENRERVNVDWEVHVGDHDFPGPRAPSSRRKEDMPGELSWTGGSSTPPTPHSLGHRPLVLFLFTIQGSFPCSKEEIISGLEAQSPGYIRRTGCGHAVGLSILGVLPLSSREEGVAGLRNKGGKMPQSQQWKW